jgi:putative transcriptional regulator
MNRNLFDEMKEGFSALQSVREGKITLREHVVEMKPALSITPEELMTLREKLHMSWAVFAKYLRTNARTLENWEQGRASSNAQPRF